jgi:uncharacterized protein (DUF2164 family)
MSFASKTFKREYAAAFAGVLLYTIYMGDTEMVNIIIWPFVTFIAAAAGLHIYGQGVNTTDNPSVRMRGD